MSNSHHPPYSTTENGLTQNTIPNTQNTISCIRYIYTPCFVATFNCAMGILIELRVFVVYKVTGSNRKEMCSHCTDEECRENAD
jgi:hypothetical protein